ncbi:MAG: lipoyl synthase [Planctomycetes bacterium]|nr:lipoyl synthase [Planctomycetota bacterium]
MSVLDPQAPLRKPAWLKRRLPKGVGQKPLENLLHDLKLVTVCEEARCPNKADCYASGTSTFMILGEICTRHCSFCSVGKGKPLAPDPTEPDRLAEAARRMNLSHVVITSVDRDDLKDGGAAHWAAVVRRVKEVLPQAKVEVLTPDFQGKTASIDTVIEAQPHIFNHNIETVPSLYWTVRPGSIYARSLDLLRRVKERAPKMTAKSGLMLGLGETREEVSNLLKDLRAHGVDMLTVGQYLKPVDRCADVARYATPEEFADIKAEALSLGFPMVASGPYVRSSYNAKEQFVGQA